MRMKVAVVWIAALAAGAFVGVAWRSHRRDVQPARSPEIVRPMPGPLGPALPPTPAPLGGFESSARAYLSRMDREVARIQALAKGVDPNDSKAMEPIRREGEKIEDELRPAALKLQAEAVANSEDYLKLLRSVTGQAWHSLMQVPFESAKGSRHYTSTEGAVTYERLPAGMTEYLLEVLRSGDSERRIHAAICITYLRKQPEEVTRRLIEFLGDPDPHVAYTVLGGINDDHAPAMDYEAHAETLRAMLTGAQDSYHVAVAMEAVSRIATPEADEFLLRHTTSIPSLPSHSVTSAVTAVYDRAAKRGTEKLVEDRCLQALAAALRPEEPAMNFGGAISTLFRFPLAKALPVIEAAAGRTPTPELRDQLLQIAAKIREGETRTEVLSKILYPDSGRRVAVPADKDD